LSGIYPQQLLFIKPIKTKKFRRKSFFAPLF